MCGTDTRGGGGGGQGCPGQAEEGGSVPGDQSKLTAVAAWCLGAQGPSAHLIEAADTVMVFA